MRVLAVMPTAQVRGGGEQMLIQAVRFRPGDIDWTVVFLEDGPLVDRLSAAGASVAVVPAGRLRELERARRTTKALREHFGSGHYDVAVGWMAKAQLYIAPAARGLTLPNLWYQLSTPRRNSWIDRAASAMPTDAVITLSRAGRQAQQQMTRAPVELVYPGAELDRFDPSSLPSVQDVRAELDLPAGTLVGIVTRLQRWKGVHVLIRALPGILARHPDLHCVVVGGDHPLEPEYPKELEAMVAAHGLGGHVSFVGLQPNPERWMHACNIVVHTSDDEPFGIVIIEALALGKPVIATDTGGPAEILTPELDGLLVPYGREEALTGAVLRILDEDGLRDRLGRRAVVTAQRFSAQAYAATLHEVLSRYAVRK